MSRVFLKVKIKSLAEEARIIRHEEHRSKWRMHKDEETAITALEWGRVHSEDLRRELHLHRVCDVRQEARAAQLAYGYVRGRKYDELEQNPKWRRSEAAEPNWHRVRDLVWKYGDFSEKERSIKGRRDSLLFEIKAWKHDPATFIPAAAEPVNQPAQELVDA
jgi:hypothetical protein